MATIERTNVALVAVLWLAGLGAAAQFGKFAVLFDMVAGQYGPTKSGFVVSVVGIVGLVFGTTAGLMVERIGLKRVVIGALILGAGLSAVQATDLPFGPLMLTRVAEGFSHLGIVVAAPVLISRVTAPRHYGAAMSLWSSFFGVSFALMAWGGNKLGAAFGPWAVFLGHSGFMALIAAMVVTLAPSDDIDRSKGLFPDNFAGRHLVIYASPWISGPAVGFVCYTAMYVALLTLLPTLFVGSERDFVASMAPLLSIAVSLTLGVWLLGFVTAWRLVRAGYVVSGIFGVLLAFAWGTPAAVWLALALLGGLGIVQGASFASIPQLNAGLAERSQAAGALAQLGNLGTTTGTPILAALVAWVGHGGVTAFVLPIAVLGVVMTSWLAARRSRSIA